MAWVRPGSPARKRPSFLPLLQGACAGVCLLAPLARADSGFWISPFGGNWSNPANWSSSPAIPNGVDETATFGNVIGTSQTIVVDIPITLGGIRIDADSNYTWAGQNITLDTASGPAAITVGNTYGNGSHAIRGPLYFRSSVDITNYSTESLIVSGGISGPGELRKLGPGMVILDCNNGNWRGAVSVEAGTLVAGHYPSGHNNSLGAGAVHVHNGATLELRPNVNLAVGSNVFANDIRISGHGVDGRGALRLGYSNNVYGALAGTITLNGEATICSESAYWGLNIGDPSTGAGALTGAGPLIKTGGGNTGGVPGVLQLNVRSTHTGGTIVKEGTFLVGRSGSLVGTGGVLVEPNGQLCVMTPAGTDPATNSVNPHSVNLQGGALALGGDIDPAPLPSPASTGGTLLLRATNSFSAGGSNVLNFDTLPGGSAMRLGSIGSSSIREGVALIPDSASHTLRFGGGDAVRLSTISPEISWLFVRTTIADVGNTPTHVNHDISGMTSLQSANTYSGLTTVNGGTLIVAATGALGTSTGDADATIVSPGGTLRIESQATLVNETIILNGGSLIGAGEVSTQIVLKADSRIGVIQTGGNITGNANVTLITQANLHVANSYTGLTTVVGNVDVYHPRALGTLSAGTVVSGGQLNLFAPTDEAITVASGALDLRTPIYDGHPITLAGGTLTNRHGWLQDMPVIVASPVIVAPGVSRIAAGSKELTIAGGISGPGTVSFGPESSTVIIVDSPLAHDGDVIVNNAAVQLNTSQDLKGQLTLSARGALFVDHGGDKVLRTHGLSIIEQGTLYLADNHLIVQATAATRQSLLAKIGTWIRNGQKDDYNQPRIDILLPDPSQFVGPIALINDKGNGTPLFSDFHGQVIDTNAILVTHSWNGDANLDGAIDAADYFLIDSGFITQKGGYRNGDFNYDGVVDAADYFLIDSAFIGQTGSPGFVAVPEPAVMSLLAACLAGLRRRRLT